MLSFAARRFAAAMPALALCVAIAAAAAGTTGLDWAETLAATTVALGVTLMLVLPAVAMGSAFGALVGIDAGLRPRSPTHGLALLLGEARPALPAFLLAAVLATMVKNAPERLALLWLVLAVPPAAQAARLAHGALAGALEGGALLAARARGLNGRDILWNHAVPLALAPVAGGLRAAVLTTLTGAVTAEALFGLPGAGRLLLEGARGGEAGLAVAALAGLSALTVLLNAAAAVLHGRADPQMRRG